MTREQILNIESTELSLAVAEHIFQAKVIDSEKYPGAKLLVGWYGEDAWKPMKGKWRTAWWRESEEEAWLDCPKFGEDISAAWEVVEKMQKEWAWTMYMNNIANEVTVRIGGGSFDSKNVPEAICKAALLALKGFDSTESPSEAAAVYYTDSPIA